jgi:N-acetyl-alpha-D-muramate 1-phosphate uridylyltransferase
MLETAMILAAGRGERMRPLTDQLPKPLLEVGGKALIVWHLERLAAAGFKRVVINHAWMGHRLEQALGNGERWGLRLAYSPEESALETAGGIAQALPLLGDQPFVVVNGDIFCDYPLSRTHGVAAQLRPFGSATTPCLAWCVMVPNAAHHPGGDFAVHHGRLCQPKIDDGLLGLTFSGIAVYQAAFFLGLERGQKMPLRPLLERAMSQQEIGAEFYDGLWLDIGTPERLYALDATLRAN